MSMIDSLNGKTIIVLGFARQGRALARWLPSVGARVIVNDSKPREALDFDDSAYPNVEFVWGGHPPELAARADLICVSGGVPLELSLLEAARERSVRITNDAQLFVERCPAPILGITGSAGKTTTTTLTGEIMRAAGHTVWVGGNTGDVLLDVLADIQPDHRVVMELSSFQLDLMTVSPPIGAILNITPNHLDRHPSMEAYIAAKAHMIAHQRADDIAVLGWDDGSARALGETAKGEVVWFSGRDLVSDGAFMAGSRLIVTGRASPDGDPHVVCERADIPLRGDHNVLNAAAACAMAGVAGVSPDAMLTAIRAFRGVPHRLETVRVLDGVTYVNDSIATAPERVTAALKSYREPLILLLGGRDKKLPWESMIALALTKARHIVAFGELGDLVVQQVRAFDGGLERVTRVATLDEAVAAAREVAQAGDVVLLSPGGTSYDAYTDFAARGAHFRALVAALR
jgi:UDP-N-acetylmuramoylalanine--D-glutamate ligase